MAREEEKVTKLGDLPRLPLPAQAPPWSARKVCRWSTRADIGPNVGRSSSAQQLKDAALEAIRLQGPFEWTIYTDGTPGGDNHDSGAAAVVTKGPPDKLMLGEVRKRRGRALASAYEAEVEGVKLALSWLRDAVPHVVGPVLICTDCRTIIEDLASTPTSDDVDTAELRELLDDTPIAVSLQWVPGHAGLEGNDWADREARKATTGRKVREEDGKGVPLAAAKARIRRSIQDPPIAHAQTRAVYQGSRSKASFTRKEVVLLAQLRSGHCRRLAAYHKVVDDTADATFPQCGREPETLEHWLQTCTASAARRKSELG